MFYKQWALNDGTSTVPPTDATVTYKLFSKTETGDYTAVLDEENNPVTITLTAADQVEGNTTRWVAVFEDLPSVDNDGHHLNYYVQETSCSPDYFIPYISASAASPMTEADYEGEGGAIVNKKKTTDITIKKVVDGPDADQDISFSFTASLPEGTDFPEQNAQDVIVSGSTVTFSLKHSEEVVLTGIPIGDVLTVTETVDGTVFTTTAAGRTDGTYTDSTKTYSCTVIEETGAIVFTNTHKQGVLRLIKNVTGDEPYQLSERSFIFNVSGPSYPLTETEEDGETVTSGGTTVPITVRKSGNSWTGYVDLPSVYVGTYTVTEDGESAEFTGYNWTLSPDGAQNVEVKESNTASDPASVTITNTYEQIKENVVFYKVWVDDDNAADYRYSVSQFTSILNLDNGVEGVDVPGNISPTITVLEGNSNVWKIAYNVPSYANGVQASYSLTENYQVYQYSTTYTNEGSDETAKALPGGTIVNKLIKTDLTLLKVDANDDTKTLSGVQFRLLRSNDENEIPTSYTIGSENGIYETDSNGNIQFSLPDGYYTLKEIKTADGYIIDTSDFEFSIVDGKVTGEFVTSSTTTEGDVTKTTYTITVPNTPGTALPNTGGGGTWAFTVLGAVFLLIGVFFGCVVRYRGRRFDY